MLTVQTIVRRGKKSSRVVLSNGAKVKLPTEFLVEGLEIPKEDFVVVESGYNKDLVHISLKPKKRERTPVEGTLPADFNSVKEISLIRVITEKWLRRYKVTNWTVDQLDDWCMESFLAFWENDFYKRYDAERLNYNSFISVGVRNRLADYFKAKTKVANNQLLSLNVSMNDSSSLEFIDTIPDTKQDIEKRPCLDSLLNEMRSYLETLDTKLTGVTYPDIFDAILKGTPISETATATGYSEATITKRKNDLVSILRDEFEGYSSIYKEYVG